MQDAPVNSQAPTSNPKGSRSHNGMKVVSQLVGNSYPRWLTSEFNSRVGSWEFGVDTVLVAQDRTRICHDAYGWRIMRLATIGLWPLVLLVGVAVGVRRAKSSGQRRRPKLEAAWASLRARNARDYAIVTPNGIDEARYVEVGGIQQWITIRGEDRSNPVLLFLHGGPGDATNPWGYAGFRLWLKHFTVVQWDQRGAGRTFGKNPDAPPQAITVARMTQDGVELADVLRKQLRKDKKSFSSATRGGRSLESTWRRRGPTSSTPSLARARWPTRRRATAWHIENC